MLLPVIGSFFYFFLSPPSARSAVTSPYTIRGGIVAVNICCLFVCKKTEGIRHYSSNCVFWVLMNSRITDVLIFAAIILKVG